MRTFERWTVCVFLLVLASGQLAAQDLHLELDPPPGRYGEQVELRLIGDSPVGYRFLSVDGEAHTEFFLPFDDSLVLTAPDGGEVLYRIEFSLDERRITAEYRIDTRPPSPPQLEPPPDLYTSDQTLSAVSDEDATIFFLSSEGRFQALEEGFAIPVAGSTGEIRDVDVVAYAEDRSGNRSETRSYTYRIDRRAERTAATGIIQSPVAGSFSNDQLLLLDTNGMTDLRYSITGPGGDSGVYEGPIPVTGTGTYTLTVSGTEILTGRNRSEQVEWTQQSPRGSSVAAISGIFTETTTIALPETQMRYVLQDRPVRTIDPFQREALEFEVAADVRRVVVLRRRPDGATTEERHVLILDGRRPPPPEVISVDDQLGLVSLADTEIFYILGDDAATPEGGIRYEGPLPLAAGRSTKITAWSRYIGSAWSAPLSTVATGPVDSSPIDDTDLLWDGTTLTLALTPGTRYRIPELSAQFAIAPGPLRYRPPRGFNTTLEVEGTGNSASIAVDAAPPAPPQIAIQDTRVTVTGDGTIFYRIDGGAFVEYGQRVTLSGESGVRINYRFEAYRLVDGEQSVFARRIVPVDRRPLAIPAFSLPVDGAIFNDGELDLPFIGSYEDLQIHYELSHDGTPRIPTEASPATSSTIRVSTPDGEVRQWRLALRARFAGRQGWTPVSRVSFTVDRVPPEAPVLLRPSVLIDRVERMIIEFSPPQDDARLFYRLDEEQQFLPYDGPLSVNAPDSGSRTYRIDAYSVDAAGNRTALDAPIPVTLTSQRPEPPVYAINGRAIRASRVSLDREGLLSLQIDPEDSAAVFWRIIDTNDSGYQPYTDPYRLRMPPDGDETAIRVEAYRETSDGIRSPVARTTIVLDRSAPGQPAAPFVHRTGDGRSGFLIFSGGDNNQVFVARADGETEEVFLPTNGQIPWSIPPGEENVRISYFTIDSAGNRSDAGFLTIRQPEAAFVPEVYGVEDSGVYQSERTVELRSDLPVRYTVSLDESSPPPVHPLSALYEHPLRFPASQGEEVTVRLRYRSQNSEGTLSDEGAITFTIDRRAPDQPELRGVSADAYYPDTRQATLVSPDGDRIFFRIFRSESDTADFREYHGETIPFPAIDRELAEYRIEAYTMDRAGNRSLQTEQWRVTIDREIMYVAADARNGGDGSRAAPLRSLDAALNRAIEERRSTIFIGGGTYLSDDTVLHRAMEVLPDLALIGGFSSQSRQEDATETTLQSTTGALELNGTIHLRSIHIRGGLKLYPGGDIGLERVVVHGNAATPTIAASESRTRISGGRVFGPLVVESGASVHLERSTIDDSYVDGGSLVFERATLGPLRGRNASVVIRLSDMIIPARAPQIPEPASGLPNINTASLIVLRDSDLLVENSRLDSSITHANTTLVSVEGGSTTLRDSALRARAEGAALALRQRGGELSVENMRISSVGGRYSYGAVQRGGNFSLVNSIILLDRGEEVIGLIGSNGNTTVAHSLVELIPSAQSRVVQGFNLSGGAKVYSVNSIITTEPVDSTVVASAIYLDAGSEATVYGSLFGGWSRDLVHSAGALQWSTRDTVLSTDRFATASIGSDNYSVRGFSSELRSSSILEMEASDIAATILGNDPSPFSNRGVPIDSIPDEIRLRIGNTDILMSDLRGVHRSPTTPDIGPVEF